VFEGVNTDTSEIYLKTPPKLKEIEAIRKFIDDKICENRELQFGQHDQVLKQIINYLKSNDENIDNIFSTEKECRFQFSKHPIVNKFVIPKLGETLKIKFETLIKLINNSIDKNLEKEQDKIIKLIHSLNYTDFDKDNNILSKITDSWNAKTLEQKPVETIILSNNENNEILKDNKLQKVTTIQVANYKTFDVTCLKINLNKKIFLYSHYNAADLSMLENWKKIKLNNIDILKKSFTSLVKPIKLLGESIFIKDTLLLASAVAGTLKQVGLAHGLKKLDLEEKYKSNMEILFNKDIELFKEYAMRDSLITIIHALFINDFAFRLGSNTNPSTLGSLANKYILSK
jgi:hypothetical protein